MIQTKYSMSDISVDIVLVDWNKHKVQIEMPTVAPLEHYGFKINWTPINPQRNYYHVSELSKSQMPPLQGHLLRAVLVRPGFCNACITAVSAKILLYHSNPCRICTYLQHDSHGSVAQLISVIIFRTSLIYSYHTIINWIYSGIPFCNVTHPFKTELATI